MRRPALLPAIVLPLVVGVLDARATHASNADPTDRGEAPVGLSLFFQNGTIAPITLVGQAPRFLQELDISAEVTTTTDQGITPLIQSGGLGDVDWTGVELVEDRWTQPGDGTWEHMRFYRGARWMREPSAFALLPTDARGNPVGEPIAFDAGADDHWNEDADDGFVRRFNVRQIIQGCQAENDCSSATSFAVQGLVQVRQEQFPERTARRIPREATSLRLLWNQDWRTPRVVAVTHEEPSAYPFGYGFQPTLTVLNPPANGQYYEAGDALSVQLAFFDGQGNQLNTPGSLPTYEEANVETLPGPGVGGLRYWDPTVNAVRYYALKHREANMTLAISGPAHLLQSPKTVVPLFALLGAEAQSTSVAVDGFSSDVVFVPELGTIAEGPATWSLPNSDIQTIHVPSDALPGTYTLTIKARRDWGGEALNRAATVDIQVGQAAPTAWEAKTGHCEDCHTGRSALSIVNHGISDRRTCFGCHPSLGFEPDNLLDDRVHGIHSRSLRFPADFNNCATCHLTPPSGPAIGQYAGPDPDR